MGVLAAISRRVWAGPSVDDLVEAPRLTAALLPPAGSSDAAQLHHLPGEIAQAFGINTDGRMSRAEAMRIPWVRRARSIYCTTIAGLPLVAERIRQAMPGRVMPVSAPVERIRRPLLEQPETSCTRATTIAWTVDDLVFYGLAWWRVLDRDAAGYPSKVERLKRHRVTVDPVAEVVRVDGRVVDDQDLIRFDGPDEGWLAAVDVLETSRDLMRTTRAMSQPSAPLTMLRDTRVDGDPLTRGEAVALLDQWARDRAVRGAAYVPPNLAVEHPSWDPSKLGLTEAREQIALDGARTTNLDASWLAAPGGDSMTYKTTRDKRVELVGISLSPYMDAITDRLSLGDVTPAGQRVRFDTSGFLAGSRRDRVDDAVAATGGPVMTRDEARAEFLTLPPLPEQPPTPAPPAAGDAGNPTQE